MPLNQTFSSKRIVYLLFKNKTVLIVFLDLSNERNESVMVMYLRSELKTRKHHHSKSNDVIFTFYTFYER